MQEQSFAGATEPAQRLRAPPPCQRDPWVSLPKPFTALEFGLSGGQYGYSS